MIPAGRRRRLKCLQQLGWRPIPRFFFCSLLFFPVCSSSPISTSIPRVGVEGFALFPILFFSSFFSFLCSYFLVSLLSLSLSLLFSFTCYHSFFSHFLCIFSILRYPFSYSGFFPALSPLTRLSPTLFVFIISSSLRFSLLPSLLFSFYFFRFLSISICISPFLPFSFFVILQLPTLSLSLSLSLLMMTV